MSRVVSLLPLLLLWSLLAGCDPSVPASGDLYDDYNSGNVVVVSKDGASVTKSDEETCEPGNASCVTTKSLGTVCKGEKGPADVLIKDGKVIKEICYPPAEDGKTDDVEEKKVPPKKSNQGRITFAPEGDGTPREGGLNIEGNGNVVYGNGSDKTLIEGDSKLTGNDNRVRGVTITGNTSIEGNNTSLVLSVIRGNLTISGNNVTLADVMVFGNLTITGNNETLMRVFVTGKVTYTGNDSQCIETYYFTDSNKNASMEKDERGDSWGCTREKKDTGKPDKPGKPDKTGNPGGKKD